MQTQASVLHNMLLHKLLTENGLVIGAGKDVALEVMAPSQMPQAFQFDEDGEIEEIPEVIEEVSEDGEEVSEDREEVSEDREEVEPFEEVEFEEIDEVIKEEEISFLRTLETGMVTIKNG